MSLRDEIISRCSAALRASKDCQAIAEAVSVGRVRLDSTPIGIGAVLDTLGPDRGGVVLNALESLGSTRPACKWAVYMLRAGTLDVSLPSTRATILEMSTGATALMTAAEGAALMKLAERPDPVTELQVRQVGYSPTQNAVWTL